MYLTHIKTLTFLILFGLYASHVSAQLTFEKGYFIDNEGTKVEGLIENADWNYNPTTFQVKFSQKGSPEMKYLKDVREFGIIDGTKYQRFSLSLDRSSGLNELVNYRQASQLSEEVLFLKVMIEGKARLFQYLDEKNTAYFFSLDGAHPVQLISKDYLDENNRIIKGETYRQQLMTSLRCEQLQDISKSKLPYTNLKLVDYFRKYNDCQGSSSIRNKNKRSHKPLWITFRPGLSSQTVEVKDGRNPIKSTDFGRINALRIGLEAEYFLRYSQNQWSLLFETSFQQFNSDTMFFRARYIALQYKAISTTWGVRHYFGNNKTLRVFANAKLAASFPFNSIINYEANNDVKVQSYLSTNLGLGLLLKNRISLEINFWPKQNFTQIKDYFHTISFILGIRFY